MTDFFNNSYVELMFSVIKRMTEIGLNGEEIMDMTNVL